MESENFEQVSKNKEKGQKRVRNHYLYMWNVFDKTYIYRLYYHIKIVLYILEIQ